LLLEPLFLLFMVLVLSSLELLGIARSRLKAFGLLENHRSRERLALEDRRFFLRCSRDRVHVESSGSSISTVVRVSK
jgi:hypothetical protein